MTDYTLTSHTDDPVWASREPLTPAPALWVALCLECEKGNTPRERGYGIGHRVAARVAAYPLAAPINMDGYTPFERVETSFAPSTPSAPVAGEETP